MRADTGALPLWLDCSHRQSSHGTHRPRPDHQWITVAAMRARRECLPPGCSAWPVSRRRAGAGRCASWWPPVAGVAKARRASRAVRPAPLRQVVHRYALRGPAGRPALARDFAPSSTCAAERAGMAQHAFTRARRTTPSTTAAAARHGVGCGRPPMQLQLLVSDDGCGLFKRIEQSFAHRRPYAGDAGTEQGQADERARAPQRPRPVLHFAAGRCVRHPRQPAAFQRRGWDRRHWQAGRPAARTGTTIYMAIALDTPRTLDACCAPTAPAAAATASNAPARRCT